MMFLVGLMGLMAVGATAIYGFDGSSTEDDSDPSLRIGPDDEHNEDAESDGLSNLILDEEPDVLPDDGTIDWGGEDDDTIEGTAGLDQLNGYEGNDEVHGLEGDDRLLGDDGDDSLYGDEGNDVLHGGSGYDILFGGDDDDELYGHDDDDTLYGEDGDDSLIGSDGDDVLHGGTGDDALHGDLGDDTLVGGEGADTLFGGWGDDVINGVPDGADDGTVDYLNGGGGDDLIVAGKDDIVTAGEGADTIALGDWLNQDHQAEILDYSVAEDSLMVVYDDTTGDEPDMSIEEDEDDPDRQHVMMNGVRIALVESDEEVTLDQIILIGQSTLNSLTAA